MNRILKKVLIFALTMTLAVSCLPCLVLADEAGNGTQSISELPDETNDESPDGSGNVQDSSDLSDESGQNSSEKELPEDESSSGEIPEGGSDPGELPEDESSTEVLPEGDISFEEIPMDNLEISLRGYFYINAVLSDGVKMAVDVAAASKDNGANVRIYYPNKTKAQLFYFENVRDNLYRIINVNSGKVLDVAAGSKDDKANVQQYKWNGTGAQLWYINRNYDGSCMIINSISGKCLTVAGGKSACGTNIYQMIYTGDASQQFFLEEEKTDLGKCTVNFESKIYEYTGTDVCPEMTLSYAGNKLVPGLDYDLSYSKNGAGSMRGTVKATGKGAYTGSVSKSFEIIDLTSRADIKSGVYSIRINFPDGVSRAVDVLAASKENGANVHIYYVNNTDAQSFMIEPVGNAYKIINVNSKKALDVSAGSVANKANVWQYTVNGTSAQLWYILKNGDGTYSIINKGSGKSLDVYGGYSAPYTNVWQYARNGSAAQKFELVEKKAQISKAVVSGVKESYLYNGTDVKPEPTVKYMDKVLTKNVDYKLTYSNVNGSSRKGSVTITGIGSFEGTVTKTFNVFNLSDSASLDFSEGEFSIAVKLSGKELVLDIAGGSTANGANVQICSKNKSKSQQFVLTKTGDAYTIKNPTSEKVLSVENDSILNLSNVWQYGYAGSAAQQWYILDNHDGTCSIISKKSLKSLDVYGGFATENNNVDIYSFNGSAAQKFIISPSTAANWDRAFFAPYESGPAAQTGKGPSAFGVDKYGNFAIGWFQATITSTYVDYDVHDLINTVYNYDKSKFGTLSPFLNMSAKELYNNQDLKTVWLSLCDKYWDDMFCAQQVEVEKMYLEPALAYFKRNGINMDNQPDIVKGAISSLMVRWGNTAIFGYNMSGIKAAYASGNTVDMLNAIYDARIAYDNTNMTTGKYYDIVRCNGERPCSIAIAQGKLDAKTWIMTKKPLEYNEHE
ncbi:MAG: RICIN domain-containing protein [Lachnospiraceae bacterium]